MIRKTMVLAMAVGAMAALALPASAAANWKHHTQEIASNVSLGLTGQVWFAGEYGGVECQITTEAQFTANTTTGHVKTFLPHPNGASTDCDANGGLNPCQVKSVQADGLFWLFHTVVIGGQPKVQVTTGDITGTLTGGIFCLVKAVTLKANENVTVIPNVPETVSWVESSHAQFQGQLQTNNNTTHTETVQGGVDLDLEPKDGKGQTGTWSI